ncbi:DUF7716 domain-containing protein [Photorhabdus heterorhabditis]|uniref:DUF7716 domain-containing protein n=1 Tax=Photorhabdus heterorhabditis TaxID=880156 RepID=UPI001BD63B68|nr:hypothetical protein [Photorhabdus heterorhabditis]MBS9444434.1 hypothetical protein [Photorhabdus heterorhabditis]
MKMINGFDSLLAIYEELPGIGGFFVDADYISNSSYINNANYYLPDTEEEDEDMYEMEDKYKSWLEYPTFKAIINNKLEHHPNATRDELLEAVVYYLEEDDFLD